MATFTKTVFVYIYIYIYIYIYLDFFKCYSRRFDNTNYKFISCLDEKIILKNINWTVKSLMCQHHYSDLGVMKRKQSIPEMRSFVTIFLIKPLPFFHLFSSKIVLN